MTPLNLKNKVRELPAQFLPFAGGFAGRFDIHRSMQAAPTNTDRPLLFLSYWAPCGSVASKTLFPAEPSGEHFHLVANKLPFMSGMVTQDLHLILLL